MRGIEAQFLALQKGFNEIIPQHLLRNFDERELEVSFDIFIRKIKKKKERKEEETLIDKFDNIHFL